MWCWINFGGLSRIKRKTFDTYRSGASLVMYENWNFADLFYISMKIFRYFSLLSCDFSSKNYQSQTSIQQNSTGKLEITDERFRLSRIEMLKIFENIWEYAICYVKKRFWNHIAYLRNQYIFGSLFHRRLKAKRVFYKNFVKMSEKTNDVIYGRPLISLA